MGFQDETSGDRQSSGGRRSERGFSFVSFLLLAAAAGAVWWAISYGGVYWDNFGIRTIAQEGANLCYTVNNNDQVREMMISKLRAFKGLTVLPEDVRIERTASPAFVRIDVTFTRTVTPLFGSERTLTFTKHGEADLSPTKY
jgi:hypothetical protein